MGRVRPLPGWKMKIIPLQLIILEGKSHACMKMGKSLSEICSLINCIRFERIVNTASLSV